MLNLPFWLPQKQKFESKDDSQLEGQRQEINLASHTHKRTHTYVSRVWNGAAVSFPLTATCWAFNRFAIEKSH